MAKEKLAVLIEAIAEAKEITPKGRDVTVYISSDNGLDAIYTQELSDMLLKLQDDEQILVVTSFPEWLLSSVKFTIEAHEQRMRAVLDPSRKHFTINILESFDGWCADFWATREILNVEESAPTIESGMGNLGALPESEQLPREAVFSHGKPYDAYEAIKDVVTTATNKLIIVDPYVDGTLLPLLANVQPSVQIQILTEKPKGDFMLAGQNFKDQRKQNQLGTVDTHGQSPWHFTGQAKLDLNPDPPAISHTR